MFVSDVRRWAAVKTHGASRFLRGVQAALEDVQGATKQGQYLTAFYQARITILKCLSIRSLACAGELQEPNEFDQINFDPFAGLDAQEVDIALDLLGEPSRLSDERYRQLWLANIERLVVETEAVLGHEGRFPPLRSPEGLSVVIRLSKDWDRMAREMGLPTSLPVEWVGEDNVPSKQATMAGGRNRDRQTSGGEGNTR